MDRYVPVLNFKITFISFHWKFKLFSLLSAIWSSYVFMSFRYHFSEFSSGNIMLLYMSNMSNCIVSYTVIQFSLFRIFYFSRSVDDNTFRLRWSSLFLNFLFFVWTKGYCQNEFAYGITSNFRKMEISMFWIDERKIGLIY